MSDPISKPVSKTVDYLLQAIKSGEIALPDLQRPFVWDNVKVRELLDSMNRGFPVGYVMLWYFPDAYDAESRSAGIGKPDFKEVRSLLIDGQQRLTALLSVMKGVEVKDNKYRSRRICISFNPLAKAKEDDERQIGRFEVKNSATEKDPEWVTDITKLYNLAEEKPTEISPFIHDYCKDVNASREKKGLALLTSDEQKIVEENINRLLKLRSYQIPVIAIDRKAAEDDVREIFVRVNSGGQKLVENNFIETLLAVYDNDLHGKILHFCEEASVEKDKTSFNHFIKPQPAHLIRAAVALGFRRARLKYAYMLMSGRDLETGETTKKKRENNLEIFRCAMEKVLDLNNWHGFLNLFPSAGYINEELISSDNAVIFSYALYLIGKYEFRVPARKLRNALIRYIFTVTVTAVYSGSAETFFEEQLAELNKCKKPKDFLAYIDEFMAARFTESYFEVTLPNELKTSYSRAPTWCAFVASQIVLGAQVWLGTSPLASLLAVGSSGTKRSYDKHHIFPKNYLTSQEIDKRVDQNQAANFVFIDYQTNDDISDKAPAEYVPEYRRRLGEEAFAKSCAINAIPANLEDLSYTDFLKERRVLMAKLIKAAYRKLCADDQTSAADK